MKKLLILLVSLSPLSAFSTVNVEWVEPEKYRDPWAISVESAKSREMTLNSLETYIKRAAGRHVDEGETLTLRVTELDLAGRFDYSRGPELADVRIVRSADFARIAFDYTLTNAEGEVLKEGSERLTHMLLVPLSLPNRNEQAPYVRALIHDWVNTKLD